MNDRPEESPLSHAEDERIRRLLAEARHTEPMPERLVQRFDRVLAGLAAEQADERPVAPVVDLASRRRRTAATLLVAAAAVIVAGVGIGQILPDNRTSQDAATTAESQKDQAAGGDAKGGDAGAAKSPNSSVTSSSVAPAVPSPDGTPARLSVAHIRSAHFGVDVRKARSTVEAEGDPAALAGDYAAPPCPAGDYGDGLMVGATYDGAPAALVLRQPTGDVQVVDLYLCGTAEATRSITLTYP